MASVDQGLGVLFIRAESKVTPASPQPNTAAGGGPAGAHGWYGWTQQAVNNLEGADLGLCQVWAPSTLSVIAAVSTHTYLMQAYESGGSCSGNVLRVWKAIGTTPDTTAAQYTGPRCSPTPGTFSNFAVLGMW